MRREDFVSRAATNAEVNWPGYLPTIHIVTPRLRTIEMGGARPQIETIGEVPPVASQGAVRSKL
jgi:hypothetical protein